MDIDLGLFVESYLGTAAWVTVDLDECQEFTDEAKERAEKDCMKFIRQVQRVFGAEKAEELINIQGRDVPFRTAHDFFLTRNGHGAGFWDNPENYGDQETADKLSLIAEEIGEVNCYHIDGKDSQLTFD